MGTGYYILTNLFYMEKTQTWLIEQLAEKGVRVHKSDMSRYLHGKRTGAKADAILNESAEIIDTWKHKN